MAPPYNHSFVSFGAPLLFTSLATFDGTTSHLPGWSDICFRPLRLGPSISMRVDESNTKQLLGAENVTVFAPTDAAFAEIDNGAGLSVEDISTVLTYHAALGRVFSSSLSEGQTIGMLNQQSITVQSISGEDIVIEDTTDDGANVLEVNVHGSNGVIHVLDKVLIPEL